MRTISIILSGCLVVLAGCASHRPAEVSQNDLPEFKLPPETSINLDAGRGNLIVVNVSLMDGKERAFVLDTGAGITCVDTLLAAKLGRPTGTVSAYFWGEHSKKKLYAMPAIYLGGTRLRSGPRVMAMDLNFVAVAYGQPVEGILGMDVLTNYCVQLDFAANKLRFLDDAQADKSAWGRAFPIRALNAQDLRPAVAGNLLGEPDAQSLIDSGYLGAGWLMTTNYAQWTNRTALSPDRARLPDARFFGETYPEMELDRETVGSDGLGVEFLSRHLVTLDFPKATLYLKRTSVGPLPNTGGSPVSLLKSLKERGLLPGWSKYERGTPKDLKNDATGNAVEVGATKDNQPGLYHYKLTRPSADAPWQLIKAWRTDAKGRVLKDFQVPNQASRK